MTEQEEQYRKIADERIPKLEALGFKMNCNQDHVWYERGDMALPSSLILGAGSNEWRAFLEMVTTKKMK